MKKVVVSMVGLVVLAMSLFAVPTFAQVAGDPAAVDPSAAIGPVADGISGFLVNLSTSYPWLATVLLIIGGLRVVFKPIMTVIDGYVKSNCSSDEYAKLQSFEAGPVYRWLNFGLDFVGSVKLPVIGVKPAQK